MKHAGLQNIKALEFFSNNIDKRLMNAHWPLQIQVKQAKNPISWDSLQVAYSKFYLYLIIISIYSARLEEVTQAVQVDVRKRFNHTQELLSVFNSHRRNAEHFKEIFSEVQQPVERLDKS